MNEDRLNEIEAEADDWPTVSSGDVLELVAAIRLLRGDLDRINQLTGRPVFGKETEPDVLYIRNADVVNIFDADWLRDRALLADPGDSHTHAHTDRDDDD